MRDYELALIVRPDIEKDDVTGTIERVSDLVKSNQGAVTSVNVWGRRNLAYPIKEHREGTYVVLQVQFESTELDEFERSLRLNEDVIRYQLLRVED